MKLSQEPSEVFIRLVEKKSTVGGLARYLKWRNDKTKLIVEELYEKNYIAKAKRRFVETVYFVPTSGTIAKPMLLCLLENIKDLIKKDKPKELSEYVNRIIRRVEDATEFYTDIMIEGRSNLEEIFTPFTRFTRTDSLKATKRLMQKAKMQVAPRLRSTTSFGFTKSASASISNQHQFIKRKVNYLRNELNEINAFRLRAKARVELKEYDKLSEELKEFLKLRNESLLNFDNDAFGFRQNMDKMPEI